MHSLSGLGLGVACWGLLVEGTLQVGLEYGYFKGWLVRGRAVCYKVFEFDLEQEFASRGRVAIGGCLYVAGEGGEGSLRYGNLVWIRREVWEFFVGGAMLAFH